MVSKYREKISSLEGDILEIEAQEKEERELRATENQMNKAARLLEEKRDTEQAKRVWFQTHQQREQEKGWFPTNSCTVKILKIWMPQKIAVIILKLEHCGYTID